MLSESLHLFGDTGGGVTGSLSCDCGVFILELVYNKVFRYQSTDIKEH